jgi:hypothetical protein
MPDRLPARCLDNPTCMVGEALFDVHQTPSVLGFLPPGEVLSRYLPKGHDSQSASARFSPVTFASPQPSRLRRSSYCFPHVPFYTSGAIKRNGSEAIPPTH